MGRAALRILAPAGADLSTEPTEFVPGCPWKPCTGAQVTLPDHPVASPIDGVATRWRVRSLDPYHGMLLNVLRPIGAGFIPAGWQDTFTDPLAYRNVGRASGDIHPGITENPVRLTVRRGDSFGFEFPDDGQPNPRVNVFGSTGTLAIALDPGLPPHQDGQDLNPSTDHPVGADRTYARFNRSGLALTNVTIEPDADRDGWGDETQDNCPEVPNPGQERRLHLLGGLGDSCAPKAMFTAPRPASAALRAAFRHTFRGTAFAARKSVKSVAFVLARIRRDGRCNYYNRFLSPAAHPAPGPPRSPRGAVQELQEAALPARLPGRDRPQSLDGARLPPAPWPLPRLCAGP